MIELKPSKGWKWRIILVDENGYIAYDDMKVFGKPMHKILDRLTAEIIAKKIGVPDPENYAYTHTHYYCDEMELPEIEEE